MQAWIYSPLQRIASDSGMEEGREGMKCIGVGGKRSETKRASIARKPSNWVSYGGRSKKNVDLPKLSLNLF